MKREDLRSKIIPTTIDNTDEAYTIGNEKFNTTDFIYLDDYDAQNGGQGQRIKRDILATDYTLMNNAYAFKTRNSGIRSATCTWLRTSYDRHNVYCLDGLRKLYHAKKQ